MVSRVPNWHALVCAVFLITVSVCLPLLSQVRCYISNPSCLIFSAILCFVTLFPSASPLNWRFDCEAFDQDYLLNSFLELRLRTETKIIWIHDTVSDCGSRRATV